MLRIGLTGGIASGKTTVAELFAARGVTVLDTDVIAREIDSYDDARKVMVLTDDERPLVFYGDKPRRRKEAGNGNGGKDAGTK